MLLLIGWCCFCCCFCRRQFGDDDDDDDGCGRILLPPLQRSMVEKQAATDSVAIELLPPFFVVGTINDENDDDDVDFHREDCTGSNRRNNMLWQMIVYSVRSTNQILELRSLSLWLFYCGFLVFSVFLIFESSLLRPSHLLDRKRSAIPETKKPNQNSRFQKLRKQPKQQTPTLLASIMHC